MNKTAQSKISQEEIFDQVKKSIINLYGSNENEIVPQAKLSENLGADSLDQIELLMELSTVFEFTIPETMDMDIITVQDVVTWVTKHTKA